MFLLAPLRAEAPWLAKIAVEALIDFDREAEDDRDRDTPAFNPMDALLNADPANSERIVDNADSPAELAFETAETHAALDCN